jgi:transcriptional regulator with XRE-family HTH domain
MVERLSASDTLTSASISAYELGQREPPLAVLLAYARLANVYLDVLADDELDLPQQLPAKLKSEGTKRKLNMRPASKVKAKRRRIGT